MMDSAVVDTNVLVSSLLTPRGVSSDAMVSVLGRMRLLQSEATFEEFKRSLSSPDLRRFFPSDIQVDEYIAEAVSLIAGVAKFIPVLPGITLCRDPVDNMFLDLAVAGKADVIVSGDRDLLVLKNIRGVGHIIPILSPADYLLAYPAPAEMKTPAGGLPALLMSMRKS